MGAPFEGLEARVRSEDLGIYGRRSGFCRRREAGARQWLERTKCCRTREAVAADPAGGAFCRAGGLAQTAALSRGGGTTSRRIRVSSVSSSAAN